MNKGRDGIGMTSARTRSLALRRRPLGQNALCSAISLARVRLVLRNAPLKNTSRRTPAPCASKRKRSLYM